MSTTDIRYKLHYFIEAIDDERANELYTFFRTEMEKDEIRKGIVKTERQNYLAGKGNSYTWAEVKLRIN